MHTSVSCPSLLLCIVLRHISNEGTQGNNIAACVIFINKNFKSLIKGGILENCITKQ